MDGTFTILWVGERPADAATDPDINHLVVGNLEDAREVLMHVEVDALICAEKLSDGDGYELLRVIQKYSASTARVLVASEPSDAARQAPLAAASAVISRVGLGGAMNLVRWLVQGRQADVGNAHPA